MFEHPLPPAETDEAGAGTTGDLEQRIKNDKDVRRAWRNTYHLPEGAERSHARLKIAATWAQRSLLEQVIASGDVGGVGGIGNRIGLLMGAMMLATPYLTSAGYHAAEARHARGVGREFFGDPIESGTPPRTLMLTDTFDELNGVAGTMRNLADRAAALDLPITVVAPGEKSAKKNGIITMRPLVSLPVPAYRDDSLALGIPSLIELLDIVEETGAEAIHAATPGPMGLAGMLVARVLGLPFAITHSTQLARYTLALTGDRLAAEAVRASSTWLYKQSDLVFTPTALVAEGLAMEGIDPEKVRIFGRGVDTRRFDPSRRSWFARRALTRDADAVLVLVVARLSEEKGIDRLIDAVNMVARDGHKVRLAIVGDGPARPALEAKLEHSYHKLLGPMSGPRLAAVFASADIFCLPSLTETLGQVALEAQASGVPAIVPRGTALAEQVIDGVTGIHAESASAEDIAAALLPLVVDENRRLRMGEAARASMVSRPTWDDIFAGLVHDYADLHREDPVERLMLRRSIEAGVL
jgi:glycosyltransferase involved in cell wall biosynthesis